MRTTVKCVPGVIQFTLDQSRLAVTVMFSPEMYKMLFKAISLEMLEKSLRMLGQGAEENVRDGVLSQGNIACFLSSRQILCIFPWKQEPTGCNSLCLMTAALVQELFLLSCHS